MRWIPLTELTQLDELIAPSNDKTIGIYKHSTRCSISVMVKKSLEMQWTLSDDKLPVYYLDLLSYRAISNRVADVLDIEHQSPQFIVIKNGKAIYDASHSEIDYDAIVKAA
jgi:bacillithiol system protein YtxJ